MARGRAALESRGAFAPLREQALEILEAENEDPDGFQVTSHVVATARR